MDRLQIPPIVTSDFVYLRSIGDRRLAESQFGEIQIDSIKIFFRIDFDNMKCDIN